ncbi:MAG: hypothetical protein M1142_05050 [Patescibacteria group bacterium]|nr:hypothetical protein [Patescibacteria group bacterium]
MAFEPLVPKEPTIIEPVTGEKPVIKVEPPQEDYEKKRKIIRERQIVWYALMVIEAILAIRFLLRLFGANPNSFFSVLINVFSTPLVFIFSGLFSPLLSPVGSAALEWSTLFAMVVYAVVAFLAAWYFRLRKPIDPKEAEDKAEETIP